MTDAHSEKSDTYDAWVKSARARFNDIKPENLVRYIQAQPDVVGPVEIKALSSLKDGAGMSNGIAFFTASLDLGTGRKEHELVLRYDPGVSLIKQKSFSDEFHTLIAARKSGLPVPNARWLDEKGTYLGCAGFIMDRVIADAPAMAMYSSGPLATAAPEVRKQMMLSAAGMFGKLKKAAIPPTRVPHLLHRGEGEDHIFRELDWWLAEATLNSQPMDPEFRLVFELNQWLKHNRPPARPASLTHGDGQIANLMFRDGKVAAWLDWELAYLGHQEADLMMILMVTQLSKPPGETLEGIPTDAEYIERFEAESGAPVEFFPYFKLFMVYKYLVGVLFAREVLPNFNDTWAAIVRYRDAVWPEAKEDARSYAPRDRHGE